MVEWWCEVPLVGGSSPPPSTNFKRGDKMDEKDNDSSIIDKSEYFSKIQEAVKARNEFLEEHPELKRFQKEIEKEMSKAGSWENRWAILKSMMDAKMQKLNNNLKELQKIENNAEKEVD